MAEPVVTGVVTIKQRFAAIRAVKRMLEQPHETDDLVDAAIDAMGLTVEGDEDVK